MSRTVIESIEIEFRRYHDLTLAALTQLNADQINDPGPGGNNSIAVVVQHVSGNLRSRFSDFLTTDGEKPDRNRDAEFDEPHLSLDSARALWSRGFDTLFATLATLDDAELQTSVVIRRQPLTVVEALHRSLAHTAMHAGQIVYLAKSLCGPNWHTLSIPRGQSEAYNKNPTLERPGR